MQLLTGLDRDELATLERWADARHLASLWNVTAADVPHAPTPAAIPHRWRGRDVRAVLDDAARLVPTGEPSADRRVLGRVVGLSNPGTAGAVATTDTLFAGVQVMRPGERVVTHRHSMSAIRFGMEGDGVVTCVDGTDLPMRPRDLVVTPAGAWHGHSNTGDGTAVWLDGLDLPLVSRLAATWFDLPVSASVCDRGRDWCLRYPWEVIEAALEREPRDGGVRRVRYGRGGRVTGTLGCDVTAIDAGHATRAWREAASSVVFVVEGAGTSEIADLRLSWQAGDVLCVPAWTWQCHRAAESTLLFRLTDAPALQELGLSRSEHRGD